MPIKILDEVLSQLPDKSKISISGFEGANIILYTKDKEFFLEGSSTIKNIVNTIKKRVELRPDPSITMDLEKAKTLIEKILPKEAGVSEIIFDSQRSMVIIETEKPGLAIGKQGELLRQIKRETFWVPVIRRTPAIRSKIMENIRRVLYENNDYRKKFLNKIGERVYGGWTKDKKNEWVRVSFLGGGRQVGRSCLLLQTPESKILLDCGVNVAADESNAYPILDAPEFNIENLDAVILSHPHLDHSGFIPWLYKMGYKGPLYCVAPTRDISALLALDFIGVAQKEAKKSLFDVRDVKEMVKHTICLNYEEVTDITPDIRITLYNAGHTLGSSMVHLHIGNGLHNLLYTGDIKYLRTQLLEPAVVRFPRLETVIIESTYGSKEDILPSRKSCEVELINYIKNTLTKGGKVLIPVLGVGRAQEVMLILEKAMREKALAESPIYVQGMVKDVTAIHTGYPDFLNKNVRKNIFHRDANPFLSPVFKWVGSKKEQEEIIHQKEPCIIMATSGMMTGGSSVEYFKQLAENPKNAILFVCYQGEGSLGRRIQQGEKEILMPGAGRPEMVKVLMNVTTIAGLTGHAGRNELTRFIYNLDPKPKKIIVNHGESSKCLELASTLHKLNRIETVAPKNLECVRLR
jgi:KH/beta-lactamase-domain protein